MPKLQYRFRLEFLNFGTDSGTRQYLTSQVVDCSRPSVEFGEIPIEVYNSRIYLAGKPTWQPLTCNLRDDASGTISRLVGQQLQKQFDFGEQASAAAGVNYKFALILQILDGSNGAAVSAALETWELGGVYISSANYNQLNYGTNEPVTISLTMRYDNAIQTESPGGLAQGVGQQVGSQYAGSPTQVGSTAITGTGGAGLAATL
jgi:hypothetical protein